MSLREVRIYLTTDAQFHIHGEAHRGTTEVDAGNLLFCTPICGQRRL